MIFSFPASFIRLDSEHIAVLFPVCAVQLRHRLSVDCSLTGWLPSRDLCSQVPTDQTWVACGVDISALFRFFLHFTMKKQQENRTKGHFRLESLLMPFI